MVALDRVTITQGPTGRRPWTAQDERRLAMYWGVWPDARVAAFLNRTEAACKIRATRVLRQNRLHNHLLAADVARVFGIDPTTVHRLWRRNGWITLYRLPVRQGSGHVWGVDALSLQTFILTQPWAYDRTRMQPGHALTQLAEEVWQRDPWLTLTEAMAEVHYVRTAISRWCLEGYVEAQRRPHYGRRGGSRVGEWMVRRASLLAYVARRDELEWERRSIAARAWRQARAQMASMPLLFSGGLM